jgi:hypothetical protein
VEHTFEGVRLTQAPRSGDRVVMVALTTPPVVFGVGEVTSWFAYGEARISVVFTSFPGAPLIAHDIADGEDVGGLVDAGPGLYPVSRERFTRIGRAALTRVDAPAPATLLPEWMVSVALPIEAPTPADAVREFWGYVQSLGPAELPAFVWPRGDELALQAYVSNEPVNLDPEED